MKAIEIKNLTKKYQDFYALKNLDLTINKGEIFGFLGPNGAGKSTLVRIISTLTQPTSGDAKVLNYSINKNKKEIRKLIGVALQDSSLDPLQTGEELLTFHSNLNDINKFEIKTKVNRILKMLDLYESKDKLVKTYSGGMKRRLDLGLSLVHSPEILFLDEPTTGLDPGSRRVLWDEIKRLRDNGVTIILTTQYLEEADELADRIAIIDEGLVVAEGTSDELKAAIGGDVITFAFENNNDLENAKNILKNTVQEKNELRITVEDGASKIPIYLKDLSSNGVEVSSVSANKPTLDDVFLKVTGYRLEGSEDITKEEEKSER